MGCCPSMGIGLSNVSLSTAANYQTLRQGALAPVKGTTVTLGVLVPNMTGTATLTIRWWVSFDGGATLESGGTAGTIATPGVTKVTFTAQTAPLGLVEVQLSGTNVWCMVSVVVNYATP